MLRWTWEIVALDAATGEVDWVYHTMPEAEYTGERTARSAPAGTLRSAHLVDAHGRRRTGLVIRYHW